MVKQPIILGIIIYIMVRRNLKRRSMWGGMKAASSAQGEKIEKALNFKSFNINNQYF
jgi:hypothetical protein